jgi:hypothetical protein
MITDTCRSLVSMAWLVVKLRMEEMNSRYGGGSKYIKHAVGTVEKAWSSTMGFKQGLNTN